MALGVDAALKQIEHDSGEQLDPDVVIACRDLFKAGFTLEELSA